MNRIRALLAGLAAGVTAAIMLVAAAPPAGAAVYNLPDQYAANGATAYTNNFNSVLTSHPGEYVSVCATAKGAGGTAGVRVFTPNLDVTLHGFTAGSFTTVCQYTLNAWPGGTTSTSIRVVGEGGNGAYMRQVAVNAVGGRIAKPNTNTKAAPVARARAATFVQHGPVGNPQAFQIRCGSDGSTKWLYQGQYSQDKCPFNGAVTQVLVPAGYSLCLRDYYNPNVGCQFRYSGGVWWAAPDLALYGWTNAN